MAYAAGWIVYNNAGTEIFHSGSNPNFSSFVIFRPDEKTGVAVLCNTNTTYSMDIAQAIINLFSNSQGSYTSVVDFNQTIDKFCTVVVFILFYVICVALYSLISSIYQLVTTKEKLNSLNKRTVIKIIIIFNLYNIIYFIIQYGY